MKFHADEPAELYIIARDNSSKLMKIPLDCQFNFHFVNAFEEIHAPTTPSHTHTKTILPDDECSPHLILGK